MEANITRVPELTLAFEGITHVYHCAALVSFEPNKFDLLQKNNVCQCDESSCWRMRVRSVQDAWRFGCLVGKWLHRIRIPVRGGSSWSTLCLPRNHLRQPIRPR